MASQASAPRPPPPTGRDLTLYCAADCDLNHTGTPHAPWDCNAPADGPILTVEQRRTIAEQALPWVRHATPLLLSASEVERLRLPITAAMLRLQVDEDGRDLPAGQRLSGQLRAVDQRLVRGQLDAERASARVDVPVRLDHSDANQLRALLSEAAGRLEAYARHRAEANPPYMVGPEDFTRLADQLREWDLDLLDRQQCPFIQPEQTIAISLNAPQRQHQPARGAGHER